MNLSQLKTWACGALLVAASAICAQAQGNEFNTPGNVLISDQYNNRVRFTSSMPFLRQLPAKFCGAN